MHSTKLMNMLVFSGGLTLSSWAFAHEGHDMMMANMPMSNMQHHAEMQMPETDTSMENHQMPSDVSFDDHSDHDHRHEHGGQIYQATKLDNQWRLDKHGQGEFNTELETRIGTDENKLFIKAHHEKSESQKADYAISALYSRNIAEFWDAQAGLRYRSEAFDTHRQEAVDAALGLHGLAPYFFETDAYLYVGQDQHISLSLETERDLLLTQKLITQPYISAEVLIRDESDYAQKTGLSSLQMGIQTRYEINKKVMPFVDVAYRYEKGDRETSRQVATGSESGWLYGVGISFKF
ncbi:copper resistance protein B [Acinetobacter guerrae]|uniref:copper resistance protein B n=1 Tax=Acinetobacter guerrae TaxID=1843371 RepID=UPI00128C5BD8|nr:copper resistance protein B [Acinetobacter guerrae]MPW44107.1 copper resistance protein CopB [Acinetobacter guerrae]